MTKQKEDSKSEKKKDKEKKEKEKDKKDKEKKDKEKKKKSKSKEKDKKIKKKKKEKKSKAKKSISQHKSKSKHQKHDTSSSSNSSPSLAPAIPPPQQFPFLTNPILQSQQYWAQQFPQPQMNPLFDQQQMQQYLSAAQTQFPPQPGMFPYMFNPGVASMVQAQAQAQAIKYQQRPGVNNTTKLPMQNYQKKTGKLDNFRTDKRRKEVRKDNLEEICVFQKVGIVPDVFEVLSSTWVELRNIQPIKYLSSCKELLHSFSGKIKDTGLKTLAAQIHKFVMNLSQILKTSESKFKEMKRKYGTAEQLKKPSLSKNLAITYADKIELLTLVHSTKNLNNIYQTVNLECITSKIESFPSIQMKSQNNQAFNDSREQFLKNYRKKQEIKMY